MEDDAVQEQRRRVDLHGAAQEAVEDPNVPARPSRQTGVSHFLLSLATSAQHGERWVAALSATRGRFQGSTFPARQQSDVASYVAGCRKTTTVIKSNYLVLVSWSSEALQNVIIHFPAVRKKKDALRA